MTKLDCNVVSCSYNENKLCKRDNITVGGMQAKKPSETVCESFYPRGTNTMTNMDGKGASKETNVACNAVTCMYNDNNSSWKLLVIPRHVLTDSKTAIKSRSFT